MSEERPEKSAPLPEQDETAVSPWLFPEGELPERPDLVQLVRQGAHKFTGERLCRDRELCRAIVGDLILGLSDRAIARKYRVSRNSILGIEQRLRATGEMESVKTQILADLNDVILVGLRVWKQKLIDDKIPAGQIPIPVMAALDKKVQLEAGVVLGTSRTERELSTDDLAAAWERLKQAGPIIDVPTVPTPTVENVSTAELPVSSGSAGLGSIDVVLDVGNHAADPLPACPAANAGAAAVAPAPADASRPPEPAHARAQDGGGGSRAPAAGGVNHTGSDSHGAPPTN